MTLLQKEERAILTASNGGNSYARKFLKQTLGSLFTEDPDLSEAPVVRSIQAVNSAFSLSVGRHNYSVNFKMKPVEAQAELGYKGYVDAALSYNVDHSELKFEVSKQVVAQTYAYTHVDNHEGAADKVGVRWGF